MTVAERGPPWARSTRDRGVDWENTCVVDRGLGAAGREAWARQRELANKALALDPNPWSIGCYFLKVDPIYDGIRDEPRFQALLKKVGLAE
jgi:hypothetical protein